MAIKKMIGYFEGFPEITLLGFGKEGQSAYHFLRKHFPQKKILVADINRKLKERLPDDMLNDSNLTFSLGRGYLNDLQESHLIIASPGIPIGQEMQLKWNITNQTDLFLKFYGNQVIGVTGTKGKSTTSSLIHHILRQSGKNSRLIGNIGSPPFDHLENIRENSLLVYEMSAHQLSGVRYSPHIAIVLNLFSEHLDHFSSLEAYFDAKIKITRYQTKDDFLIFNKDDELLNRYLQPYLSKRQIFGFSMEGAAGQGIRFENGKIIYDSGQSLKSLYELHKVGLKGRHNILNILAASCAARIKGIDEDKIREAVESFSGLEHRLEYAGCFRQIDFYNDSIATVPEATIAAIRSLENIDTLILGGFDRGLNYDALKRELTGTTIRNLIYTGEAGKRMIEEFQEILPHKGNYFFENFVEAVQAAIKLTKAGSVCLLSPAAASYDQFVNFEERGRLYKKMAETA